MSWPVCRYLLLVVLLGFSGVGCSSTSPYIASSLPMEPRPELKALLDRAARLSRRDRQQAERLIEEALARLEELPLERDREIGRMYALAVRSLVLGEEDARLSWYRRMMEMARELGGSRMEAQMAEYVGLSLYQAKRLEEAAEALGEAAGRFRAIGEAGRTGATLMWQASTLLTLGYFDDAEAIYGQARALSVESGSLAYAVACDAALGFVARADRARAPAFMTSYGWACEMVREEAGALIYAGRSAAGGYSASGKEGKLRISLLYEAGMAGTLLDATMRAGDTWTHDTPSADRYALRTKGTLVTQDAHVTVPAGTFSGCRVVRLVTQEAEETRARDARTRRMNRARCGVREVSYAPGVGIVRLQVALENGVRTALVLKGYRIQKPTARALPLDVGNQWVYGWEEITKENYLAEQVLEVRNRDDAGTAYLAHFVYAHRPGRPPGLREDVSVVRAAHTPQDLPVDVHAYLVAHERISQWTDHARFETHNGETVRVLVGENDAGVSALQVTPTIADGRVDFEFVAVDEDGRVSVAWFLDGIEPGKAISTATRSVLRPEYMLKARVKPHIVPPGDVSVTFDALFAIPPTQLESRRWRMQAGRP